MAQNDVERSVLPYTPEWWHRIIDQLGVHYYEPDLWQLIREIAEGEGCNWLTFADAQALWRMCEPAKAEKDQQVCTMVCGNYGVLDVAETGLVLAYRPSRDADTVDDGQTTYSDIVWVDIAEHRRTYGWVDATTDICDVGYWIRSTDPTAPTLSYVPVDPAFRLQFRMDPAFYRDPPTQQTGEDNGTQSVDRGTDGNGA